MSQIFKSGSGGGGNTRYPITPYTVGPSGQAAYQTIQSAIDAAVASGGLVFIQNGSYVEDLTLHLNINLWGESPNLTEIVGSHTPPATGGSGESIRFQGITLTSSSDIFASSASSSANMSFNECVFNTTSGGYAFNLPNWTGEIDIFNCSSTGVDNGFINNSSTMTLNANVSTLGTGSANVFTMGTGNTQLNLCTVNCPSSWSGILMFVATTFNSAIETMNDFNYYNCIFNATLTISTISEMGIIVNCYFNVQSGLCMDVNANGGTLIYVSNCSFTSQIHPVISGTGNTIIEFVGAAFTDNAMVDPALVVQYGTTLTGNLNTRGGVSIKVTVVTNALSPYSVASTDEFIACDGVGGAITVSLPAVPIIGTVVQVCDSNGHALANNITVDGNGNNITLSGTSSATQTIAINYQLNTFTFNGSFWNGV